MANLKQPEYAINVDRSPLEEEELKSFNGKPKATACMSHRAIEAAVAFGLPLASIAHRNLTNETNKEPPGAVSV